MVLSGKLLFRGADLNDKVSSFKGNDYKIQITVDDCKVVKQTTDEIDKINNFVFCPKFFESDSVTKLNLSTDFDITTFATDGKLLDSSHITCGSEVMVSCIVTDKAIYPRAIKLIKLKERREPSYEDFF